MSRITAAAIETGNVVTWMRSDVPETATAILKKINIADPKPIIAIEQKASK